MTYEEVNKCFIEEFPEFRKSYKYFFDFWGGPEDDWQYLFYEGLVFYIINILLAMKESKERDAIITRLFIFVEKMIFSDDDSLSTLAAIAFFEYRHYDWFNKASNYMSENLIKEGRKYIIDQVCAVQTPNNDEIMDVYGVRLDLYQVLSKYGIKMDEIPGITVEEVLESYENI